MSTTMCHFLLVYNHREQQLETHEQFEDGAAATDAYAAAEREAREQPHLEIVLVGADSFDTIRQTHASYFDGTVAGSRYLVGT
ncbi:MAG: hypothetical protein M3Q68_07640 [Actinomycetota bacterium]|nr:hypothetical protein [Actinomycetota bacterium]